MLPPPTGPPVSIVKSKGVSLALEILAKALKYYLFSASFLDYNLEKKIPVDSAVMAHLNHVQERKKCKIKK